MGILGVCLCLEGMVIANGGLTVSNAIHAAIHICMLDAPLRIAHEFLFRSGCVVSVGVEILDAP